MAEAGLTMVLVTHDSTASIQAQRLAVMNNGLLEVKRESGTPAW